MQQRLADFANWKAGAHENHPRPPSCADEAECGVAYPTFPRTQSRPTIFLDCDLFFSFHTAGSTKSGNKFPQLPSKQRCLTSTRESVRTMTQSMYKGAIQFPPHSSPNIIYTTTPFDCHLRLTADQTASPASISHLTPARGRSPCIKSQSRSSRGTRSERRN